MKLRFDLDVAECLVRGIDVPGERATIDIDPARLPDDVRVMLAARLSGTDVHTLARESNIQFGARGPDGKHLFLRPPFRKVIGKQRLRALASTLQALIEAIRADDLRVEELIETGEPITQEQAGERHTARATSVRGRTS